MYFCAAKYEKQGWKSMFSDIEKYVDIFVEVSKHVCRNMSTYFFGA